MINSAQNPQRIYKPITLREKESVFYSSPAGFFRGNIWGFQYNIPTGIAVQTVAAYKLFQIVEQLA